MDKKLEALALEIFNEYKGTDEAVTMEEATEMARQEIGAKEIKNYTKSDKPRKKTERKPRKLDDDKVFLLGLLIDAINAETEIDNTKNDAQFDFHYNNKSYSVKLVLHREKKA